MPKSEKLHRTNFARSKPRKSKKSVGRKVTPRSPAASTSAAAKRTERPDSKASQVIALLRSPSGATLDAMMRLTAWQQHSVRGFLAAVVRKKLGLDLQSKTGEGGRVYRISQRTVTAVASTKPAA